MIQLIASDLDGTILQNGAQHVEPSTIEVIEKLVDRGIVFAPASGRQLESLKKLFAPVADRLAYISENGALVTYQNEIISKIPIARTLAMDIIEDVYVQENCEVLASGEHYAYIRPKSEFFRNRMTKVVNYETIEVGSFEEIEEDLIKIAVCDISGIEHSQDHFLKKWGDKASVAVSGSLFLDITAKGVNKGVGIERLAQHFGYTADECMAFGDNFNDVQMLDHVTHSYVMQNAVEEIQRHGAHTTDSVERVLRGLL